MQSSTMVLFRAMVMLACLVVVPLAAIFGSAFPEVVRSVLVDRLLGYAGVQSGSAQPGQPAPQDGSPAPSYYTATASQGTSSESATAWPAAPATMSPRDLHAGGVTVAGLSAGGTVPASYAAAAPAPIWPAAEPQRGTAAPGFAVPARPSTAVVSPAPPYPPRLVIPAAAPASPGATVQVSEPGTDGFSSMERLLKQQGATYYLLETWGAEGELYRFHCKMAVAGNPNYTRHFEATDRDALSAMRRVLEQVEAWRSGRLE